MPCDTKDQSYTIIYIHTHQVNGRQGDSCYIIYIQQLYITQSHEIKTNMISLDENNFDNFIPDSVLWSQEAEDTVSPEKWSNLQQ